MVEIEDRIGEKWKWKWKRAGEVKVPKRDDLVLWPYAAGGRNEGGKGGGAEGQGRAGRKAEKGSSWWVGRPFFCFLQEFCTKYKKFQWDDGLRLVKPDP